jgi:CMP-N,N'-diacetyllegionaminic acid synthase
MKIICTICARGGSQGVKNKNILKLCGKPLIAHSILQAKASGLFDAIAVCSDSKKIRHIAKNWGADYVFDRPAHLATSTAAKLPAIQYAVLEVERLLGQTVDFVVDLDATAPLRAIEDIIEAFEMFKKHESADNLITACLSRKSPYFNMVEVNEQGFTSLVKMPIGSLVRRQDCPPCYDMNASIYIWRREALFFLEKVIDDKTMLYVMPEERSIDIDTQIDLQLVRLLAKKRPDLK